MKLAISSYSAVLLGVVALSSMGANAQSIEDVINMISTGEVQGTDTPILGGDDATEDGVPVDTTSDITEDGAMGPDMEDSAAPSGAPVPVPPPKPITCIDRSLEVSISLKIYMYYMYGDMYLFREKNC